VSLESCKGVIIRDNEIDPEVLGRNIKITGMKRQDMQIGKAQFLKQ
jgi:MOSC domain-containing protein YiiM